MISLRFRETLGVTSITYEVPVADLAVETVGTETFLVAATQAGGGLASFSLAAGRGAQALGARDYPAAPGGLSGVDLLRIDLDGAAWLLPVGPAFPDWSGRVLDPGFGARGRVDLAVAAGAPAAGWLAETVTVGGTTWICTVPAGGQSIETGRLTADPGLAAAAGWSDPDPTGRITALAGTGTGGLLAAGTGNDALVSFRVQADGGLSVADRSVAAAGPGLETPMALEVVTLADGPHAVLAAAGSGSLTVYRIGADGSLTATDHVLDTLDTRFGGASLLATADYGDWHLVLAAGNDDGLSLFALLPGGRLLHLDSIADSAAATLDNVSALAAAVLGDGLQVFAASQSEPGISRFEADLSGLGVVRAGDGSGATVEGSAGMDVLGTGGAADALRGGAGADVFLFAADGATADGRLGAVLDFSPGADQIDLSALPFLYDPAGVTVETTVSGAILRAGAYWLEVTSAAGGPLAAADFEGAILAGLHAPAGNVDIPDPGAAGGGSSGGGAAAPGQDLAGGAQDDVLVGGPGDDTLTGRAGDDRLVGEAGRDRLDGGTGADTLNGGDGDDTLVGGGAGDDLRDVIYGGAGDDTIDAGAGNDLVYGQGGNDTIAGGFGVDELRGQDGNDVITGSAYSDLVFGGAGDDFINGGFGHDRINGGTGADKFYHLGIADHGSDWIQDYQAADGDVLLFGGTAAAGDFQVNYAHTTSPAGERSGDDAVMEAFVIYQPTGQILWALVDGAGQPAINLDIGGDIFDLMV